MIGGLLTSGVIGAVGGFISSYAAQKAQHQAEREERMMIFAERLAKVDAASHDAAEKRGLDGGKINRRIIMLAILLAVVVGPFVMPLFGVQVYVREEWETPEWLFGLVPAMKKWEYVPLAGYYTYAAVLDGAAALIGFYFGSAAARGKG